MKVKVLSRNPADYIRECKSDIHKIPRNIDPSLHPFEAAREYTRALNAAKLERVFAKPFIGSLDGHTDGVNCMAKFQKSLSLLLSGSCNGEVRVVNIALYFFNFGLNSIDLFCVSGETMESPQKGVHQILCCSQWLRQRPSCCPNGGDVYFSEYIKPVK